MTLDKYVGPVPTYYAAVRLASIGRVLRNSIIPTLTVRDP